MGTIRSFENRVAAEMAAGDVQGNIHLHAGQKASAAGVCMDLTDRDGIAFTRGHGHAVAKGCDPAAMPAGIFGKATAPRGHHCGRSGAGGRPDV